jgi:hypothetical protein
VSWKACPATCESPRAVARSLVRLGVVCAHAVTSSVRTRGQTGESQVASSSLNFTHIQAIPAIGATTGSLYPVRHRP